MPLLIDRSSSSRRLDGADLRAWCERQAIFISSEMGELGELRERLADALRGLGLKVIYFEDLGGRDEDAETAYLDGVARSDIYLGVVANRYGRMLPSGRSPTHEEYLAARDRGKRISVWVAADGSNRQGHALDFVQELQTFHTTGSFASVDDLIARVSERLAEIAADDESPWVKVGDAVFRASVVLDRGATIEIQAEVRESSVAQYLAGFRPDTWGRRGEVQITTATGTGNARIEEVVSEVRSTSRQSISIKAAIEWAGSRPDSMAVGTTGYSADDLAELGLRRALLKEPPPAELGMMELLVPDGDPLADLDAAGTPPAAYAPIARLLVLEYALGRGFAGQIDDWLVGPPDVRGRTLRLAYREPRRYTNVDPGTRVIEGVRPTS